MTAHRTRSVNWFEAVSERVLNGAVHTEALNGEGKNQLGVGHFICSAHFTCIMQCNSDLVAPNA